MRRILIATLLAVACCADRKPPEPAPPRERPLAQDGTIERAITSVPDRVKVQLDVAAVRTAVQAWKGEHGAWPRSLSDVSVEGLNYPADLTYDPETGKVGSQTYPSF